jgi:hypothetical protein
MEISKVRPLGLCSLQSSSPVRNVFSRSAFSNVLETSIDYLAEKLISLNSLLMGIYFQVAVNHARALSVVTPRHTR